MKDEDDDKNKKLQVRLNNKCNLKDVIRCKSCLLYVLDNYNIRKLYN